MNREPERPDGNAAPGGAGESLFDWPRQTGHLGRVMEAIHERERRQRLRRSRRRWAVGVAAVALGASWLIFHRADVFTASGPDAIARAARITSPQRQVLPEGSIVELKDKAEIAVAYTDRERRVVLQRGEAHFEVRKETGRVFVVEAGGVEFRAVGTAFAVQLNARRVEMIVTEGRVAVGHGELRNGLADQAVTPTIVAAGSQAEVRFDGGETGRTQVQTLAPQQVSERLAWRVPRLELNETPLSEVVAAFNRHGPVRLRIGERGLGEVAISGILRADNAGTLLQVLESNYGIRAERDASGTMVLKAGRRR